MFLTEEYEKNNQISFLENLLIKLRNDQLSIQQQRDLTEFYVKTLFKEQINEMDERNEKYMTYMSLGWYIYEILSKESKESK